MSRRFVIYAASLAILVGAAYFAAGSSPAFAQDGDPTPPPPTPGYSPEQILDIARRTTEDASRAVEASNTILSVIEAFGVLIGGLLALLGLVGAGIGVRTLGDLSRTRQRFSEEMESALQRLRAFETRLEEETDKLRSQASTAMQALTLLQMGKQQMDAGNLEAALTTLAQAHERDPENRAINYFLGELHIQTGNLDKAIEHLERAGAKAPLADENDFAAAKAAYALALRRKGDRERDDAAQRDYYYRAEGYFREALQNSPRLLDIHGESYYGTLGGLYKRQERWREARECYEKAIQARPEKSSYPYVNLAVVYTMLRDSIKAREYFTQTVKVAAQNLDDKPQNTWARLDMVLAQTLLGSREEVQRHLPLAFEASVSALTTFLHDLRVLNDLAPSDLIQVVMSKVIDNLEQRRPKG